ncbi:MAG TPA: 50S ribosomal protein L9 [Candidatus Subteraquimicrobiales bacterium]
MKVILKKDQPNLGKEGDVIDVNAGYARNFLFRKKLAILATSGNLKMLTHEMKAKARAEEGVTKKAEEIASSLEGQTIEILAKAGKEKLYGTITPKEIAEAIAHQRQVTIDKKRIVLGENIKALGTYPVTLKIFPGVEAKISLKVIKEEDEVG